MISIKDSMALMMKVMNIKTNRQKYIFIILIAISIILFLLSLGIGKYEMSIGDIFNAIFKNNKDLNQTVFYKLRLPRTIMAFVTGLALGLAGMVYQIIFKNPLASPDLIGVSSGASLGAAISIVFISSSSVIFLITGSFIGGIVAALLVLLISKLIHNHSTTTYILIGIIINALCQAILMAIKYLADTDNELAIIEYWQMGSLSNITLDKIIYILPVFLCSFILLILLTKQINLLALGDNESRGLGLRLKKYRTIILILNTLLVASVICLTGLICFIGLIAPHITRLILNKNGKASLILSSLIGGVIVLLSDIIIRLLPTTEMPISIITTLIGIPFLVIYLIKRSKS